MHIEARGLIYDASNKADHEKVGSFTGSCPLRSGPMLASFQVGPVKNAPTGSVRLCRSRDRGATWQESAFRFETTLDGVPGSLSAGEMVEAERGRLLLFSTW